MNKTQDMTAAFVLGAVVGGVVALLWAPEKGETTRKQLQHGAAQLVKRGQTFAGKIRGTAVKAFEAARYETRKQGKLLAGARKDALAGSAPSAV